MFALDDFNQFETFENKRCRVPDGIMAFIRGSLDFCAKVRGNWVESNDKAREKFIDAVSSPLLSASKPRQVINPIASLFNPIILIKDEGPLKIL